MDQDNDTYSYLYGSKESEDFFCATLLLITCLFGILVNFFSAIILLRLRVFNSAFGLLASFNALSNCGVLATFVFWAVPLTYLKYFTITSSKIGISFINVISFLYFCVYFIDGCDFKYDESTMIWTFGTEPCGLWLSTNIDLRYGVIAFVISSFIDITTLVQLRMANTKLTHIRISSRRSESDAVKIQKREVAFFLQSFANTLMFCGMLVCFHIISYWPFVVSSRFASFLSTTYIWGFSHTVSGLTLVIFNKEIRRRLLHPSDFLRTDTLSTKFNTPMQPSVITVSAFQTNGPRYNNSFGKKVFTHQTM